MFSVGAGVGYNDSVCMQWVRWGRRGICNGELTHRSKSSAGFIIVVEEKEELSPLSSCLFFCLTWWTIGDIILVCTPRRSIQFNIILCICLQVNSRSSTSSSQQYQFTCNERRAGIHEHRKSLFVGRPEHVLLGRWRSCPTNFRVWRQLVVEGQMKTIRVYTLM